MARPGTFPKGTSGNPNGRPPKNEALTDLLTLYLKKTRKDSDGKRRAGKRILARLVTDVALTGTATLPGGKKIQVSPRDWLGFVQWIYDRVDGKPTQRQQVTGADNGPLVVKWLDDDDSEDTVPAARGAEGISR